MTFSTKNFLTQMNKITLYFIMMKNEIDNYIKIYNKASNLTNIKINFDDFLKFYEKSYSENF